MRSGSDAHAGMTPPGTAAVDPAARGEPRSGLKNSLGAITTTLAAAIHTRVELASLEFTEERLRAKQQLILVLLVAIASGFALLASNVLFVLATWDSLGLYSLGLLLFAYVAVAAIGGWRLAAIARRERRPFDATLAELDRDRAWLAELFRSRA